MGTTTARKRRTAHPISHYWGMVKDMDDSQKLELVILLAKSIKASLESKAKEAEEQTEQVK